MAQPPRRTVWHPTTTQENRMAATHKNRMAATHKNRMAATQKNRMAPHHHPREPDGTPQATSASSATMRSGIVCVQQEVHNKTRENPFPNFSRYKNSGMGFLLSLPSTLP